MMKGIDVTERTLGIYFDKKGMTNACVWSPLSEKIEIVVNEEIFPLEKEKYGYWKLKTSDIRKNDLYTIRVNGENDFPDPVSLSQPEGVHGRSRVTDINAFAWTDESYKNPDLSDYIIYELHTGTFTNEGSFAGIEKKLDHLKELGVNAIEIMPVAQFAGTRNWGYDGVFPFAVQNNYGGAEGLQHLVNACHEKGLAVILDVVYNHLGPEGNYLGSFGPYTTEKYKTPWGGAINFDDSWCDGVRQYFIENALMWFRDFHIDALRLDAVHAIKDFSTKHILREIRERVDDLMKYTGKKYYLIVEQDLNDRRFIDPIEKHGFGMHAQWIDEFHHALRISAGGEKTGYYEDFDGIDHFAKAYRDAYVYDGQFSEHRKKFFGQPTDNPGEQFIVFSQNHDQVGNRMLGERTSSLASFEMQKVMAASVVLSPYLPMFFMGEEWSEPHPFMYFVSHTDPELAEAVRKGRKAEFAAFHSQGEAPDPMDEKTFSDSKLQWHLLKKKQHQLMFEYYKALISLRKSQPALATPDRKQFIVEVDKARQIIFLHRWNDRQHLWCVLNFSLQENEIKPPPDQQWNKLFDSSSREWNGPSELNENVDTKYFIKPESAVVYAADGSTPGI
jgi:maltooligosyltrehalose trehalohydrolase